MPISHPRLPIPALAILGLLAAGSPPAVAAQGDDPPARQDAPGKPAAATPQEAWWADLEKDEGPATRAALKFAARPDETVAFLAKEMKPLKVDDDLMKTLLLWLASDQDELWKTAFEQLEYFDPRLVHELPLLMNLVTEPPARQRLVEVMSGREMGSLKGKEITLRPVGEDGYNFFAENFGSWWAEHKIERINAFAWGRTHKKWIRAVRAIAVLEHIATPDARALLEAMAGGHPDAQPTRAAREALARLADPAGNPR